MHCFFYDNPPLVFPSLTSYQLTLYVVIYKISMTVQKMAPGYFGKYLGQRCTLMLQALMLFWWPWYQCEPIWNFHYIKLLHKIQCIINFIKVSTLHLEWIHHWFSFSLRRVFFDVGYIRDTMFSTLTICKTSLLWFCQQFSLDQAF